ncbi:polyphosphate kinase [Paenibacillus sp. FSL H8-0548]|uniref:PPK2 family polyphosphate kinase n=1 Tax=Paenibacillus sp. FSL H8-0548 TaxID=1920422 RepID=UPI00096EA0A2|nr:PPK2 family polyphosphate kinase [Paenibacillus sp. FSL H8-0548]OMF34700.1 polyphosphate kinase [Paenibacillus sp. FSL H8-0548]
MNKLSKGFRVNEKNKVDLTNYDPRDTGRFKNKEEAAEETKELEQELQQLQEKLIAGKEQAVLFIFQGMDCSGKDGVIKNVFAGLNPQGISAHSFKEPTEAEALHDFLWRAHHEVPALGKIAVFNRSYYEDVLITRIHGQVSDKEAKRRFKHINHFETLLEDSRVKVVKIFLHISKEFQLEKLISRIEDPTKNWKFDPSDLQERKSWERYGKYYEELFEKCSKASPWHVVPSDNRWYRNYAVLNIAVDALRSLELTDPPANPELQRLLEEIQKEEG